MPNAIELLKHDHETVENLFAKYESEGGIESKSAQQVTQEIFAELLAHAQVEEEIFYPALQDAAPEKADLVAEAVEEHRGVEELIDQLMRTKGGTTEDYASKMSELIERVRHHVQEEESEIFPLAEKALGKEMSNMGRAINSRKQEMIQRAA